MIAFYNPTKEEIVFSWGGRVYHMTVEAAARFLSELEELPLPLTGYARRAIDSIIEGLDKAINQVPVAERILMEINHG